MTARLWIVAIFTVGALIWAYVDLAERILEGR